MRVCLLVLMALLAGCQALPPNAPPLSPTRDIITPEGDRVPCTISTGAICEQP